MLSLFFFNDTATTEIYTLSLHDALPIYFFSHCALASRRMPARGSSTPSAILPHPISLKSDAGFALPDSMLDRKSTRLNSSHQIISYAVFCLKKKKDTHVHLLQTFYLHAH